MKLFLGGHFKAVMKPFWRPFTNMFPLSQSYGNPYDCRLMIGLTREALGSRFVITGHYLVKKVICAI